MALMKSKTAESYCTILTLLRDRNPEMEPNLIVSDYENGIKSAVNTVFPNAIHKGCWFHYTQVAGYI